MLTTTNTEYQLQNYTVKYFYVIYIGTYNNSQNFAGTSNIFVVGGLSKVFITPIYRDSNLKSKYLGTIYTMFRTINTVNAYVLSDWAGGTGPNQADSPGLAVLGV